MLACFLAFALGSGARFLKSISRCENRFEFSTPPLFACSCWASADGMLESDGASLPSLFKPGSTGVLTDLNREIVLFGPRKSFQRSRSLVRIRWRLGRDFAGTGRFVAAPGRDPAPEKLEDLVFSFGG